MVFVSSQVSGIQICISCLSKLKAWLKLASSKVCGWTWCSCHFYDVVGHHADLCSHVQGATYEEVAESASQQKFAICSDSEEMLLCRCPTYPKGPRNVELSCVGTGPLAAHKLEDERHLNGCAPSPVLQTRCMCAVCGSLSNSVPLRAGMPIAVGLNQPGHVSGRDVFCHVSTS